jgi:hypothetical protein
MVGLPRRRARLCPRNEALLRADAAHAGVSPEKIDNKRRPATTGSATCPDLGQLGAR